MTAVEGGTSVPPSAIPHCESKSRYGNRKEAARARTRLLKRIYNNTGVHQPIEAYHCNIHHCYHLGHPSGWLAPVQKKHGR